MQKYSPITSPDEDTNGTLKIMSYNVHGYSAPDVVGDTVTFPKVLEYLQNSGADIICLQESFLREGTDKREKLASIYKYIETVEDPTISVGVLCLSKYPIEKAERVEYDSKANLSACFHVRYNGELIRIFNNHFESIKISQDDKEGFKSYVKRTLEDDNEGKEGSIRIADHIRKAAAIRQGQVETIAKLIGDNPKNTIVLGDFNDTPLSYAHYLIDQKLTDCYTDRGFFPGFSYVNHGMFVRIDHTFCSNDFKTVKCYVDKSAEYSDHYPIITYLKR